MSPLHSHRHDTAELLPMSNGDAQGSHVRGGNTTTDGRRKTTCARGRGRNEVSAQSRTGEWRRQASDDVWDLRRTAYEGRTREGGRLVTRMSFLRRFARSMVLTWAEWERRESRVAVR